MNLQKTFLSAGAFFGFTGVALGAFGAHALRSSVTPEMLAVFETGVRYQMYHAFALITAGLMCRLIHHRYLGIAGWSFMTGVVLFSGSLYAMTFTGVKIFGAITPFGGVAFLVGWFFLFLSAVKIKKEN
ncbi:MAG: DUF423 domain-containing protein [Ignavibacteriales bacterium]|nr:DUF423 domain-containing protein [Ignavibacteriales bacterium]